MKMILRLLGVVALFAHIATNKALKLAPASTVVPYQYTLIVWAGEFGRTPTSDNNDVASKKGIGRDHNAGGFTIFLAGGGVRGGTVYGASDDFGACAVENPLDVHDLHATILHLLGLDHKKLTFRHSGRDFRLTDVHGRVIEQLFA